MSIQRDSIPFGPGKLVQGGLTLYSAGDIDVHVITDWADINPDQYGQGVKTVLDRTIEIELKPQSLWSLLTSVWPSSFRNPSIGSRLIGGTPTPLYIHGENGSKLTVYCPAITALASLMIGVDKGEFGTMKFTGVVTNGKDVGDADSLYKLEDEGGTYGTPSDPDYLAASQWDLSYAGGDLTGTLLKDATITPDLKVDPIKAGHRTMDFRMRGLQFSTEIVAAVSMLDLATIANSGGVGARNSALGSNLLLTAAYGNHNLILVSAALEKSAFKYAMKEQFVQAMSFRTAALTGDRVVIDD